MYMNNKLSVQTCVVLRNEEPLVYVLVSFMVDHVW